MIVNGTLLTDTLGREINGADDGQPGSDYIATVSGGRVSEGGMPLVRKQHRHATVVDAIDDLLARGEPAKPTRFFCTERGPWHVDKACR